LFDACEQLAARNMQAAQTTINPERMLFIFITQVCLPTLCRRKAMVVLDKINLT
jgi:hypothetical protein